MYYSIFVVIVADTEADPDANRITIEYNIDSPFTKL
jgi:hypothetical protein